jgi:sugar lactone lactonase YvrE
MIDAEMLSQVKDLDAVAICTPPQQPTCVAFGRDALDLLMVTSARETLDASALGAEPQAGNLFIFKTDVAGCEESHHRVA